MTVLSRIQVLYIPEVSTRFLAGPVEEEYLTILPFDIALAFNELVETFEDWFGGTCTQSSLQLRRGHVQMVMRKRMKRSRVKPTIVSMITSICL